MPVSENDAGSLLWPYYGLARLFASSEHFRGLLAVAGEGDALEAISFPDYRVVEDGGVISTPLIVIANPIDLGQSIFKNPDPAGRNGFGALLCTFLLQRHDELDDDLRLMESIHDVEKILDEARANAGQLHYSGAFYYQNIDHFELAIATGDCELRRLSCVDRNNVDVTPDPQVVTATAVVAHWI